MKKRLADFIADYISERQNVSDIFTITGGGAMYLNDAFGHHPKLRCIYNHHEQACAIAAEAYARIHDKIAVVCVTTGPGGTNALTGVVGAYTDSIPMVVISGQVKYSTTARSTGLPLRAMGDQEFDITKAVACMTKYAEMVIDPNTILYHLEKAFALARAGRPGPVWLDIPGNVASAVIETDDLVGWEPSNDELCVPEKPSAELIESIASELRGAKRPVIYAGSAICQCGMADELVELAEKCGATVVTAWNSIDLIPTAHPNYCGRGGIMGDRAGNFAVQSSDLILSLGCRLSIRQVGYNWETWAPEARVIIVDIDPAELKKPTLHVDVPVCADVRDVIPALISACQPDGAELHKAWLDRCVEWKNNYPVTLPKYYERDGLVNPYCFVNELSRRLPEGKITVVGNGTACVVGSHNYVIKKDQRFIINSGIASMGYDLPAAIGACFACGSDEIICVTGDGSIQMNLQELQTMAFHKLPIKLFVINNFGYHSIRQSQSSFFGEPLCGIGPESGDLSFPDLEKIAAAYGLPFRRCSENQEISSFVEAALAESSADGTHIYEIMTDPTQKFAPKSSSKVQEDGTIVSPPLEDLAPFLPREELEQIMKH